MKALVGAFNQEKTLVGAFSMIVKTGCGTDGSFYSTSHNLHFPDSPVLAAGATPIVAGGGSRSGFSLICVGRAAAHWGQK